MVEFQQELIGLDSVVVVSPAPMFGVKFIETLQSMATKMGNPLIIDAENWMLILEAPILYCLFLPILRHLRTLSFCRVTYTTPSSTTSNFVISRRTRTFTK